jgi:hypothetical protein
MHLYELGNSRPPIRTQPSESPTPKARKLSSATLSSSAGGTSHVKPSPEVTVTRSDCRSVCESGIYLCPDQACQCQRRVGVALAAARQYLFRRNVVLGSSHGAYSGIMISNVAAADRWPAPPGGLRVAMWLDAIGIPYAVLSGDVRPPVSDDRDQHAPGNLLPRLDQRP